MKQFNNLVEVIELNAQNIPHQTFLEFKEERYTYQEVEEKSNQTANHLKKQYGIKKGDHVAMMLKNSPEFLWIWFGLAKLGAVMVPLNTSIKGESLKYILNHSDSTMIIFHSEYEDEIRKIKEDLYSLKSIVNCSTFINGVTKETMNDKPASIINQDDPMAIIYTSGTTGLPKGVILPHYTYINTGNTFVHRMMNITTRDKLYTCLPLFHCNAQQLSVMGAMLSGTVLALSERFSARNFWSEIEKHNATIFNYIGSMLTILYKQPVGKADKLNTITRAFGGAAPKEIWNEFEERFEMTIVEGYGLSESATIALCNPLEKIKVGSIGLPVPYVDVKIVNDKGDFLTPGQEGEIVIRELQPNTQFMGYYKMKEKTEETVKDGWFHSGDRGFMDTEGYFYFKDRIKDCIRYRGENISSFEIEKVVNKYPDISECAAIGVPSELSEEDVKVVIVLQKNAELNYEAFIQYCSENMAYYMVPRYIEVKKSLPKTATERVQKYELRKEGIGNSWDRVANGIQIKI
ncbi:ATP-dependent acyl-CoA ligase [Alkalihalobacterium elongatum]|uniref:ATP-dependent acyl-CoA ligase n=1 Tax=Alkalihalobacterium elongatum TaxID=2675466 RepID=UPI001C1F3861|nr:ATP-dependent acyl-CoA ligase [Alkalihalobacterium elongatum]